MKRVKKMINKKFHRNDRWGVGMPQAMLLEEFGSQIWSAFGQPAYLVGSATRSKNWRDVDIRLIMDDKEYEAMGFGKPEEMSRNGKWVAYCLAFSVLGKQMTGLPIDFQIQQRSYANKHFNLSKHPRHALGLIELRKPRRTQ
jgi:hypothetical protein